MTASRSTNALSAAQSMRRRAQTRYRVFSDVRPDVPGPVRVHTPGRGAVHAVLQGRPVLDYERHTSGRPSGVHQDDREGREEGARFV